MAGFSWREIASRERISEEAARKRFSRAILELERLVRPA
jgi:DNA-directed RNA polymerase specialized sigma24 family protein